MATAVQISTTLREYRTADKPVIIPRNVLLDADSVIANTFGSFTSADQSDTSYPARNLYDNRRGTQWRSGSSVAVMHILVDAGVGNQLTASSLIIEGDDGTYLNRQVQVQVSDNLNGAGHVTGPALFTAANETGPATRLASLWNVEYTGRYWDISVGLLGVPNILRLRQCWLGTQKFTRYKSSVPYDPDAKMSDFVDTVSRSGSRTRVGYYRQLGRREQNGWVGDATIKQELRDAYEDSNDWQLPIWHIEDPGTDENASALFCYVEEPGLSLPDQLEADSIWEATMMEDGPHLD